MFLKPTDFKNQKHTLFCPGVKLHMNWGLVKDAILFFNFRGTSQQKTTRYLGLSEVMHTTGSKAWSDPFHLLTSPQVLREHSEDFRVGSSDETLGSVYIHSLIHPTCSGDGGVLCNEAFTSGLWPICLQWVVAGQVLITSKLDWSLLCELTQLSMQYNDLRARRVLYSVFRES